MWERLKEYEKRAAGEFAYERELAEHVERRKVEAGQPVVRMMPTMPMPSEQECKAHELTHIPAKLWCEHCIRGKASMGPHRAALPNEKDRGPPKVAIDFLFLEADMSKREQADNAWATTLVAVDEGLGCPIAVALDSKGSGGGNGA